MDWFSAATWPSRELTWVTAEPIWVTVSAEVWVSCVVAWLSVLAMFCAWSMTSVRGAVSEGLVAMASHEDQKVESWDWSPFDPGSGKIDCIDDSVCWRAALPAAAAVADRLSALSTASVAWVTLSTVTPAPMPRLSHDGVVVRSGDSAA